MPDEKIDKLKNALEGKRVTLVEGSEFSFTLTLEDGTSIEFETDSFYDSRFITWEIKKDGQQS